MNEIKRCEWCIKTPFEMEYHDTEWGVPLHDDRKLFEFLILDAFQAGLSWRTILNKRENFRFAFDNFDAVLIAEYNQDKFDELMNYSGIIRNKLKIQAAITNAQKFLKTTEEFGTFDNYIWQFSDYKVIQNKRTKMSDIPTKSDISDNMSKDMQKRSFKFVGTTICYAFMQAMGMVNDHVIDCFRYKDLS